MRNLRKRTKTNISQQPEEQSLKEESKQRSESQKSDERPIQPQNKSASMSKSIGQVKKKKSSKNRENEGLKIIQSRELDKTFRHLCDQNGLITVQSLGRAMIKAKKQFEMEDIERMIAYYSVVEQKEGGGSAEKKKKKKKSTKEESEESCSLVSLSAEEIIEPVQADESMSQSSLLINQAEQLKTRGQNFCGDEPENLNDEMKSQLNFEEFKKIYSHLNKRGK